MGLRDRIAGWLWGYDFFISYQWSTGGKYALALAARLRERGLDCFHDRAEFAAGDDWKVEARRALDRTQRLVVVANPEAMRESAAVRREVEIFTARNQRIVLITFDRPFTDDERKDLPTLAMISASCLSTTETAPVAAGEPSKAVVDRLVQTHDLIRRKRLRRGIVAGVIATLSLMLAVSVVLGLGAYHAQQRERRARLGEESRRLVEVAGRQRDEAGPQLDDSLRAARDAYLAARAGGKDTAGAAAAIEATLALMPEPLGAPWTPPGITPAGYDLDVVDGAVLLRPVRDDPSSPPGTALAVVAAFDPATGAWTAVRSFDEAAHGTFIAVSGRRWLITGPFERPRVWDLTTGAGRELPFPHSNEAGASSALLEVSAAGNVALTSEGDKLVRWDLATTPPVRRALGEPAGFDHHLSPFGRWIVADVGSGNVRFIDTTTPGHAETAELTGMGHISIGQVVADRSDAGDDEMTWAVISWGNNQAAGVAAGPGSDRPSNQSAVWLLGDRPDDGTAGILRRPGVISVHPQRLAFAPVSADRNPALAVFDGHEPAIILDVESGVSRILGTPEIAGVGGTFSPDGTRFLGVHADGTARLWQLSRPPVELLRYAPEIPIVQAAFLSRDVVITRDAAGALQAWSTARTSRSVADVVAR